MWLIKEGNHGAVWRDYQRVWEIFVSEDKGRDYRGNEENANEHE